MSQIDLAPITRILRSKASSHLLVSAVHHLYVFELLATSPLSIGEIKAKLKIKDRAAMVLFPALCAMGMLRFNAKGNLEITEVGRYLTTSSKPNIVGYVGLEKDDKGALEMTEYLLNDGPKDKTSGVSYVKDDQADSPMDDAELARFFTMALAGRAEFLSPIVAEKLPKIKGHLLDVAGGTGYYTFEWLLKNPDSTATVFDRPEVLKQARELMKEFAISGKNGAASVVERVTFKEGDMLTDPLPEVDVLLAASLFHDWPEEVCLTLAKKFARAIKPGGQLWVHDAFLNDTLDGPIAVTDYSAMLFLGTKGRAYSRKEYRSWFHEAGLTNNKENIPTLMDYGLIWAKKE
jgi:hypothetical protein